MIVPQRSDYTFKYNKQRGRHGWLRLTPAYSVKLVYEIISAAPKHAFILDPFSGTATTGLVAAERGLPAHCLDINRFLIWMGNLKCRNYSSNEIDRLQCGFSVATTRYRNLVDDDNWVPDIHNIHRWWCPQTLRILAALRQALVDEFGEPQDGTVSGLIWIAFCRLIIETSSAAFNHVSMSFRDSAATFDIDEIYSLYKNIFSAVLDSAESELSGCASVHHIDSREKISINEVKYSHVVTSPPYPNRISYIRELRPYMYWTKFLDSAPDAGELDWEAIGGTWGVATSRLQQWKPTEIELPTTLHDVVVDILATGEKNAHLMATYVLKYFHDMHLHLQSLRSSLRKGAILSYVVGNSSFYGIQVRTDQLLEESMQILGYTNIGSRIVRKRNSKKELFEYCTYATWREIGAYEPIYFSDNQHQSKQLGLFASGE